MTVLRADPCECGHRRSAHIPKGCTECACVMKAPYQTVRKDGTLHEGWREESHETFQPGNVVPLRHGLLSRDPDEAMGISERAERILAELTARYRWVETADGVAVDVLCRAVARYHAVDEFICGVMDGTVEAYPRAGAPQTGIEAVPRHLWEQVQRNERSVLDAVAKLGLTPVDRAALFKDTGMARHYGRESVAQMVNRGQVRLKELRGSK